MIDLTHPLETGMQVYPADPPVRLTDHATVAEDGARVTAIACGSHSGTHIDAPAHTEPDGNTLEAYPLERFVFDSIRVDCRDLGPREPITADRIPDVDAELVALWTGWDRHWKTDRYLEHPYLTPEAAARCSARGYAVGTDTLNPDPTPTANARDGEPDGFPAHHALLGTDCLIVENLTGLEGVTDRFELRTYPLALAGDGSPVRAVGVERRK